MTRSPLTPRRSGAACVSAALAVGLAFGVASPAAAAPTTPDLIGQIERPTAGPGTAPSGRAPVALPTGMRSVATDTVGVGPRQDRFIPAFAYSLSHPDAAPPGSNNFSCRPRAGQRPIVLIHGTFENAYDNFAFIAPELATSGYCVFTFNYGRTAIEDGGGVGSVIPGVNATGDIPTSARQLATFVNRVRAVTGAGKVDLYGHSQGGVMARQYLRFEGGAEKVRRLITSGATNNGTTLLGIAALGRTINDLGVNVLGVAQLPVGVSGIQQTVRSPFIRTLNAGGDTVPGVAYTVIRTVYDEVTTPSESTFLRAGPGATVDNITLQDGCPSDVSDHVSMSYSPRVISIVKHTLDPSTPVVCVPNEFVTG